MTYIHNVEPNKTTAMITCDECRQRCSYRQEDLTDLQSRLCKACGDPLTPADCEEALSDLIASAALKVGVL